METWLGRRRYLPDIASADWGKKSFAERCALNTPIQGTAADILKLALGRIIEGLPQRLWLRPVLQIHDELVFEVPEDKVREAAAFVKGCMEDGLLKNLTCRSLRKLRPGKGLGN
jgi:DNA polymerase-1